MKDFVCFFHALLRSCHRIVIAARLRTIKIYFYIFPCTNVTCRALAALLRIGHYRHVWLLSKFGFITGFSFDRCLFIWQMSFSRFLLGWWSSCTFHPIPPYTVLYRPSTIPLPFLYHPSTIPLPSLYHPSTVPLPSLPTGAAQRRSGAKQFKDTHWTHADLSIYL